MTAENYILDTLLLIERQTVHCTFFLLAFSQRTKAKEVKYTDMEISK